MQARRREREEFSRNLLQNHPMVIRMLGIALIAFASLLAGCGAAEPPAPPSPAPTVSDEDQIRDVLNQQGAAFSAWDFDKMTTLTCAKLRDQIPSVDDLVPPMDMFPVDDAASIGPDKVADILGAQFSGASRESLLGVADAVIRNDQAAYQTAMKDVVKQNYSIRLDKVDNIVVTGDTATADTTVTRTIGSDPPQTDVTKATMVREGGQWKDCTPQSQS
jgi:hypothetical protein